MVGWPSGLGGGLQNLLRRFDSYSDLKHGGCSLMVGRKFVALHVRVRFSPITHNGSIAQMVERYSDTIDASGSNPLTST